MNADDAPLTEREAMLMAYVDDELSPAERSAFEVTLGQDAELAKEATRLKNLMDLSQSMSLSEPTDHEIRRFWSRFYNRTEWRLGWVLFALGILTLLGEGLYLLLSTEALSWTMKAAAISTLLGGALLLFNTLRLKLRTTHFDRYRGVTR